jgi:hydrogenase maturation protease
MASNRIAVVGVGNLLLKDEGIGIHVVRALQELFMPDGVVVIDGGTSPDVLDYLEPADKLVIIDAAEAGGVPGAIYRFRPDDVTLETGEAISLHELGLVSSLKMMSLLGKTPPEVIIIGIQPKEIAWGMELSPELKEKVPEIVKAVLKETGQR